MDPEEFEKLMAPKFQETIYPDSVIYIRGSDDFLRNRARQIEKEAAKGTKWD
jgi:hypothetical protein